jgi:molybdopterin-guanine dinucleotide biosynthesis protein A
MLDEISGFVLIGGASSRMGENKALIELEETKLFEYGASALASICLGCISLVGDVRDGGEGNYRTNLISIPDTKIIQREGVRAPLIGVYSALLNSTTQWTAILACDLPFVTTELMRRLRSMISEKVDAVVPLQMDARPQPLCALYKTSNCVSVIEEMLASGTLKMRDLLHRISVEFVPFKQLSDLEGAENIFLNVNSPEDLERARSIRSDPTLRRDIFR